MKLSIKQQLFIFLVCFVLLSTIIIGSVMYMFFYSRMTEFVIDEIDFNIKNCTTEIENIMSDIQRFNDQLSFDENIVRQFKQDYQSTTELVFAAEAVKEEYKRLFDVYFSDSTSIVTPKFLVNANAHFAKYVLEFSDIDAFEKYETYMYKSSKTIEEITNVKQEYLGENIVSFYDEMFPDSMFFAQVIYDNVSYDQTVLGVNIIKLNLKELLLKYSSKNMADAVSLAIVNDDKNVLCGTDFIDDAGLLEYAENNLDYKSFSKTKIDGKTFLLKSYPLKFGINIFSFVETQYIAARFSNMFKYICLIVIMALALLIFVANIMSNYLSRPITKLSKTMAEFDDEKSRIPTISRKNPVEIDELYKGFSLMLEKINQLLKETENSAKKEKEMEMKVLGAQINPHFLYNALDSISWMALDKGEDEIAEMIDVLTNGFRYSIKQTDDLISLREEMKFIVGYLKLQEMRHKDKFVFKMEMDEEIQNLLIPKFVVQPLVENFIIHAIKPEGQNQLTINAMIQQDFLTIYVSDNGSGCDTELLNRYIAGDSSVFPKEKIGIKNVNGRIKIKFGDTYGLSYQNNETGGTIAVLKLPVIENEGLEEKNV
ncbi:MAG: histidine kinase [Clostridia bacterium]|nr:histidine kinase [Clostridia bacterium]